MENVSCVLSIDELENWTPEDLSPNGVDGDSMPEIKTPFRRKIEEARLADKIEYETRERKIANELLAFLDRMDEHTRYNEIAREKVVEILAARIDMLIGNHSVDTIFRVQRAARARAARIANKIETNKIVGRNLQIMLDYQPDHNGWLIGPTTKIKK